MVFSSLVFLCIFLPVLFVLYIIIRPTPARNILLVIASLVFYAYGEPIYIFVLLGSIVLNYALGYMVGGDGNRKAWLAVGVIINLAMLGVFKYSGWIAGLINDAFSLDINSLNLSLPLGISFYTFSAISYLVDVYRGDVKCGGKFTHFVLYISFFTKLTAGPIVRYPDMQDQFEERPLDMNEAALGLRRFIIGLSKKVLISNVMAAGADAIFVLSGNELNILSAWIGAFAYMMQIYFDFSGYSDMAIGLARMFGFKFKENFVYPYIALGMKDFWRRWHISLSTWFRDYLYIPLGGNRQGRLKTAGNKLIVFFSTGLWHGANLTFIVWGMIHGLFMLLEDALPIKRLPKALLHIYTVLIVCITFVIFRADDMTGACAVIGSMFTGINFSTAAMIPALEVLTPKFIVIFVLAVLFCTPVCKNIVDKMSDTVRIKARSVSYIISAALLLLCLLNLAGGSYSPFIYFGF